MKRQLPKRSLIRRPTNLTMQLQQAWRRHVEPSPPDVKKDPPAPPKAA